MEEVWAVYFGAEEHGEEVDAAGGLGFVIVDMLLR